jgi:AcrR family transcriptional regulator
MYGGRMGLRERKKQETRSALSWAAIRLVVERGIDNVLVEDIAAAAGVSPRTFNNYFSSKGEAIAARHLDRSLKTAQDLRDRPADEPLWEALLHAVLAQLEPGPEVTGQPRPDREKWVAGLKLMVQEPSLQAEMLRAGAIAEAEVAAAVAERTGTNVDRDMYPRLVAAAVMGVNNVAQAEFTRRGGAPAADMGALLTEALTQLAAGLPPPA